MGFKQLARGALGYSPSNTATLLRRDVKGLKTKAIAKVKHLFARKAARTSAPVDKQFRDGADTLENNSVQASVVGSEIAEPVHEPVQEAIMEPVADASVLPVAEMEEVAIETIYSAMQENLLSLNKTRNKEARGEERWNFRGCWLLLHMAVQYCPSNPLYEALGCGNTAAADAAVRAKIHQSNTTDTFYATPRCDEVLDTVSFHPEHWWRAIWEATCSHAHADVVARALTRHIWSENEAVLVLQVIGSPGERFFEFDAAELRRRLQVLLFPELDSLLRFHH